MDFFGRQAEARRLSRTLVLLFAVAVLAVVVAVNLVVLAVVASTQSEIPGLVFSDWSWMRANPGVLIATTVAVVGVIGLASAYKTTALSEGGGVVARALGGVPVTADTTDPLRRRLVNVVEEMAIASGVPTPEVYVLEHEAGINAFAAGHQAANAAVAVTRGALESLTRAELQGVIAHEFSHILNGDMRLSIRLMGLLFGLLVIALLARTVLRFAPRGGGRARGGGGGAAILVVAALAVLVVGYVGLFAGRLIQAAVSRGRESLADASAIQFTRDPTGLRGALVKIGAASAGSRLVDAEAEEVAHMLFAPGMRRLFATHPPLVARIRAIDPSFDPKELEATRARMRAEAVRAEAAAEARTAEGGAARLARLARVSVLAAPEAIAELVGNPGTAHVRRAAELRASLPDAVARAAEQPGEAVGLFLALALDQGAEARRRQLAFVEQQLGAEVAATAARFVSEAEGLDAALRLPALLRLFPALHQLARVERRRLLACLSGLLARGEGRISIQAYALSKLAQVHLRDDLAPRARTRDLALEAVREELSVLFSVLAQHGAADGAAAAEAYEAGMQHLLPKARPAYRPRADWPSRLDRALDRLDRLAPPAKQRLVEALVKTISHDLRLTAAEAELLRTVCAVLHCPLPPLLGDAAA
jgi:Zn-dependent protease with chaperone function